MFCDACGAQVNSDQRFCGTCGKPLGMVVAGRFSSRVADHRQILGILWVVYGVFHLVGAAILFVMAHTFFPHIANLPQSRGGPPLTFLVPLITFISILILAKGLLALAGGVGLLQRQPWARLIVLVSAFFALLSIPVGTAIGGYSIWVLMSGNGEQEYAKLAGLDA
ncbi:MAG: hypothetical protein ABIP81_02005 [Terriglobales bacterium]